MSLIQNVTETVVFLRRSLKNVLDATVGDLHRWVDLANGAIDSLSSLLESESLSLADKRKCQTCMIQLSTIQVELDQHLRRGSGLQQESSEGSYEKVQWRDVQSAFKSRIRTGVIINLHHKDVNTFMDDAARLFEQHLKTFLEQHNAAKVNAELSAEFKILKNDEETFDIKYFNTESVSIYKSTNLREWFEEYIVHPILQDFEEFQERDSGWSLKSILSLAININKLNSIRGSSYIALPECIARKKACVNVNNTDERCFLWAVLSALHPVISNASRVSKYHPYVDELNFDGISFPVRVKDIPKFERQNNISINLYMLKKSGGKFDVSPCHMTVSKKDRHVNLLTIQNFYIDENDDKSDEVAQEDAEYSLRFHYVWIKNLSRLMSSQVSANNHKRFVCDRCLHSFRTEEKLKSHEVDCSNLNKCKIELPDKTRNILKFENYNRHEKVPIVIYADSECILKPVEHEYIFQEHQAHSIDVPGILHEMLV